MAQYKDGKYPKVIQRPAHPNPKRGFKSSVEGLTPRETHLEMLRRYLRDLRNAGHADETLLADPHFSGYFVTSSPTNQNVIDAIRALAFMHEPGRKDPVLEQLLSEIAGTSPESEIRDAARDVLKNI